MITNYPTDRFFSRSAFLVGQAQRRVEQARTREWSGRSGHSTPQAGRVSIWTRS